MWRHSEMTDKIRIAGLEIACIVGIRPSERRRPQPVRVHLELGLDLSLAGKSGRIAQTVDYSRVASEIECLLRFRAYKLVEGAAEEITAALFAMHPNIEVVTLQIEKPEALRGIARAASVEVTRARRDIVSTRSTCEGCQTELRLRTHEAELTLITLDGHTTLPASEHTRRRRIEWLAGGRLLADDREIPAAAAREIEEGRAEDLRNPGSEQAILFRCVELGPLTLDVSQAP
jgi:FolB domain-containing protein